MQATYSPEDNKIRLYASARLDPETYARVKAAGFAWAPKQEIFVAPMWTPARADLAEELAGEIGDEDTSLAERAEERAERFEAYSDKRAADSERAQAAVAAIADNIPLGQPILVGHHSERRARKDAERIQSGMAKAVTLWRTSEYWTRRAEGAIRHAKHKERPDVRARRIKGIEADLRKQQKATDQANKFVNAWQREGLTREQAMDIANYDHIQVRTLDLSLWSALEREKVTAEEARDIAIRAHESGNTRRARWIEHYQLRLTYERAMLAAEGGLPADKWEIIPGGRVLVAGEWATVIRVTRKEGRAVSVSTNHRHVRVKGIEDVKDYQPPAEGATEAVKSASKLPPLVNVPPAEGEVEVKVMTAEEWKRLSARSDSAFADRIKATPARGAYRERTTSSGWIKRARVYLSDAKTVPYPGPAEAPRPAIAPPTPDEAAMQRADPILPPPAPKPAVIAAMEASLRQGVRAVAAPQLFPTPPWLARRMVDLLGVTPGPRVLEPSAGTGNLVRAIWDSAVGADNVRVTAIEVNAALCDGLEDLRRKTLGANEHTFKIERADFLEWTTEERFPAIVMNPPFDHGSDIAHIQHARSFLKPGGTLVALCANGPRQREALQPLADSWEDMPDGTFAAQGTSVRVALLTITARAQPWQ
jgi:phospholipid N-methyltransferase